MKKVKMTVCCLLVTGMAFSQAITDTGTNVGIDNVSPAHKLDVNGNINMSSGSKILINSRPVVSTAGTANTFIGDFAGNAITTGINNAFIGYKSGEDNTTGHSNAFIGFKAGENNLSGFSNAFIGQQAGRANLSGKTNVMIGRRAGFTSATGDDNVFIGHLTGQTNNGGSSNTYIGSGADGTVTLTNATAIGANASVAQDSSLILGNHAKVGIGTSAPSYDLDVAGDINFDGTLYNAGLPFKTGVLTCTPLITGPAGPIPVAANTVVMVDETAGPVFLDFPPGEIGDEIVVKSIAMPFSGFPGSGISITSPIPIEDPATPGAAYPPGFVASFVGGIVKEAYKWHYCDDVNGTPVWVAILDYEPHDSEGEAGPAGPTGPQGVDGPIGPTGPAGNTSWTVTGNDQYSSVSGDVGVGISTPSTKFHVHDPSHAFASFSTDLTGNGSYSDGLIIGTQLSGAAFIHNYEKEPIMISTNNQDVMLLDTTGFVGIGTTAPVSNLHVHGDSYSDLTLTNSGTSEAPGNGFQIGVNSLGTATLRNFESKRVVINAGQNDCFAAEPSGDCIVFNKLGIGTVDYIDALNVKWGGSKTSARIVGTSSGDTASLKLFEDGDFGFELEYDGSNDRLDLWSRKFAGNEAKRMTWTKDGKVGVGVSSPQAKLDVNSTDYVGSRMTHNSAQTGNSFATTVYETFDASSGQGTGIYLESANNASGDQYGMQIWTSGTSTGSKYGLYSNSSGSGTLWTSWMAGDMYCSGSYLPSDRVLKTNIEELENASEIVDKLKVHTYNYKTDTYPTMNLQEGERFGFIAEELKEVLPQLVKSTEQPTPVSPDGTESPALPEIDVVNYTELIPILTAAIQEQQKEIESIKPENAVSREEFDALKAENEGLRRMIQEILDNQSRFDSDLQQCCFNYEENSGVTLSPSTSSGQAVEGSDSDAPILEQNAPNPFRENSVIKYYLPSDTRTAELIITDQFGTHLKSIQLRGSGYGQTTINGGSFTSGTYIYSLMVNGVKVGSKQMILL